MTTDRALELCEGLLHAELQKNKRLGLTGPNDWERALEEIGDLRQELRSPAGLSDIVTALFAWKPR